jgi:hypothetical protein
MDATVGFISINQNDKIINCFRWPVWLPRHAGGQQLPA